MGIILIWVDNRGPHGTLYFSVLFRVGTEKYFGFLFGIQHMGPLSKIRKEKLNALRGPL